MGLLGACLAATLALGPAGARRAQAEPALASEVKAACVYKVTRFVAWPDSAATDPFVIGTLEDEPFDGALAAAFASESVGGRPVEILHLQDPEEAGRIDLLVVSTGHRKSLCDVLGPLAVSPVLTIGDFEGFGSYGGMVELGIEDRRLKLRINREACARAGLTVSSRLLALTEPATGEPCPEAP